MASDSEVARLKFRLSASADGLKSQLATAGNTLKAQAGRIAESIRGQFSSKSLFGALGLSGIGTAGVGGILGTMFSPAGLGLGTIAAAAHGLQRMSESAQVLLAASKRTGIDVETYQALAWVAEDTGTSMGTVEGAANRMRRNLAEAANGNKTVAKTLSQMGLEASDFVGLSTEDSLTKIARALDNVKDPMQRVRLEMEMFGKAGAALRPVLDEAAKGLEGYKALSTTAGETKALANAENFLYDTAPRAITKATGSVVLNLQSSLNDVAIARDAAQGGDVQGAAKSLAQGAFRYFAGSYIADRVLGKSQLELAYDAEVASDAAKAKEAADAAAAVGANGGPTGFASTIMAGTQDAYAVSIAWQYGVQSAADRQTELLERIAVNTDPTREQ